MRRLAYFLAWQQPEEIGDDTEAITVELAPIDSTPDAVARDDAPAPETMVEFGARAGTAERKAARGNEGRTAAGRDSVACTHSGRQAAGES